MRLLTGGLSTQRSMAILTLGLSTLTADEVVSALLPAIVIEVVPRCYVLSVRAC